MIRIKKMLTLIAVIACILALFASCGKDFDETNPPSAADDGTDSLRAIINPDSEVRGVWIASVYNIDYPSSPNLSADKLKLEIDKILDTCEDNNLNTVFFQVRPACDALYDSDIFPISSYLSSSGNLTFDPLGYIVTEAHLRNIYVHAWINPLRVTVGAGDITSLPENSPARKNPEYNVSYDGKLHLNAGLPEVRELVADGVREVVAKYDVDGVVFDDYFYPYPVYDENGSAVQFGDSEAFEKFGGSFDSIADWRRENINTLVKACYDAVHETDPECVFGISPFGVWQNSDGKNGGSETSTFEAYKSLYCDATAWIRGGYIDYVSPQIYWSFDSPSAPYDEVTRWWNTVLDGTNVKLYVSHAAYKYEDGEWEDPEGQMGEQISFARAMKSYRGSICYGYDEINKNTHSLSDELKNSFSSDIIYTDIQSNGVGVSVSSPENGSVMNTSKSYVLGMADPAYPLTVDGKGVSMTKSGYFSLYLTLEDGENTFIFEQNGTSYIYRLTYSRVTAYAGNTDDVILPNLDITNIYPASPTATRGDKIWVSCTSAVGSTVSVNIGGVVTYLEPLEAKYYTYTNGGYVGVGYGGVAALPTSPDDRISDCGEMIFTSVHNDGTVSKTGENLRVMGKDTYLTVVANKDYAKLKITKTSSYYNDYTVQSSGMTAHAVGLSDGFYELDMGGFIPSADADETNAEQNMLSTLKDAVVTTSNRATFFTLKTNGKPPYNGSVENGIFTVTFYNVDSATAPEVAIGENPVVKSCELMRLDNKVRYCFELYSSENFYGFDLMYKDGEMTVAMRNPLRIDFTSSTPLEGITVVLDAGHGGADSGALGPGRLGMPYPNEKDINLAVVLSAAEKLRALGADVTLMREDDETVDLYARMAALEKSEPDLCISVHQNSMDYSVDVTHVRGTLALWCMDGGVMLADEVGRAVSSSLGRSYQGARYQMLALCRNPKFPAALIEVGFMTSAEEYDMMMSPQGVKKAADGIADGVLSYFRRQADYCLMQN